ncbi:MAG: energy transducer TonB [Paludibacter sp.]|nr:energy transducer TonB [Paludibacter sp.]
MNRKIKFNTLAIYMCLILAGTGLTGCLHKYKPSDNSPLIKEMPMPDPNNSNYSPESYQQEITTDEDKIYDVVEQMPVFPGGESELKYFITKNLKYPTIAQDNDVQGKVIIRFVVTRTGNVENPQILRSLDAGCDREAMRVVRSLPRFIPGKQNGVNVSVWYTMPIKFRLE